MQRIIPLLFVLVIHVSMVIYFHFDDTFHLRHFQHGFKQSYSKQIPDLDHTVLNTILHQPFHQIGQGDQMTAYESADGKYVLKLFNPRVPLQKKWYFKWKHWKKTYSLKWISNEWFQRSRRLEKMFARLKIAFSVLREESGLIFLHLCQNDEIRHTVQLTDKKGKEHLLPLNQTPFVLQKKAILASEYLDQLIIEDRLVDAGEAILNIEELFAKRLKLGITDENQTMDKNYGFIEGKPIQIDVGKIRVEPALLVSKESEERRILNSFHCWLKERYPFLEIHSLRDAAQTHSPSESALKQE